MNRNLTDADLANQHALRQGRSTKESKEMLAMLAAQREGDQALAAQDSRAQSLRATAARWFEHPSPITQHEREMQYQAYKARLMLELGLQG